MPRSRERRPAGTKAAHLENTGNNRNPSVDNAQKRSVQAPWGGRPRRLQISAACVQRRQHHAQLLWNLGPRQTFELLAQIGRDYGLDDEIDCLLVRFASLDPDTLRARDLSSRFSAAAVELARAEYPDAFDASST
jgi:hypothetical protein